MSVASSVARKQPDVLARGVYIRNKGGVSLGLVVDNLTEAQQKDLLAELSARGLVCRATRTSSAKDPVYWIRYTDQNGVKRREKVGRSYAAACELVEQRRTEVRNHKFNPEQLGRSRKRQMTIGQMFEHYRPLRVSVRNTEEDARYGAYWTKLFGDFELDELKPADLDKWRAVRVKEVKPATVNRAVTYLKAYYNLAFDDDQCKTNPAEKLKALAENNARDRHLLPEEEAGLKKKMNPKAFSIVLFAILTGLRRGELFGLEWERVDLRNGTIKIVKTKSGKPRFVPLNAKARAILEEWLTRRVKDSPWVFSPPGRPDRHYNAHNFVDRVFIPSLEKAVVVRDGQEQTGIPNFVFHDLRHTAASRMAMAGVPINTIGDILGNPTMAKRYAHLSAGHLQEAVDKL